MRKDKRGKSHGAKKKRKYLNHPFSSPPNRRGGRRNKAQYLIEARITGACEEDFGVSALSQSAYLHKQRLEARSEMGNALFQLNHLGIQVSHGIGFFHGFRLLLRKTACFLFGFRETVGNSNVLNFDMWTFNGHYTAISRA